MSFQAFKKISLLIIIKNCHFWKKKYKKLKKVKIKKKSPKYHPKFVFLLEIEKACLITFELKPFWLFSHVGCGIIMSRILMSIWGQVERVHLFYFRPKLHLKSYFQRFTVFLVEMKTMTQFWTFLAHKCARPPSVINLNY